MPVAKASDASLDRLNLAVDSLSNGVGDLVLTIVDDVVNPLTDGAGHLLQWMEAGVNHTAIPLIEPSPGRSDR